MMLRKRRKTKFARGFNIGKKGNFWEKQRRGSLKRKRRWEVCSGEIEKKSKKRKQRRRVEKKARKTESWEEDSRKRIQLTWSQANIAWGELFQVWLLWVFDSFQLSCFTSIFSTGFWTLFVVCCGHQGPRDGFVESDYRHACSVLVSFWYFWFLLQISDALPHHWIWLSKIMFLLSFDSTYIQFIDLYNGARFHNIIFVCACSVFLHFLICFWCIWNVECHVWAGHFDWVLLRKSHMSHWASKQKHRKKNRRDVESRESSSQVGSQQMLGLRRFGYTIQDFRDACGLRRWMKRRRCLVLDGGWSR